MSRQFSIPTVLRMTPNRMLKSFFAATEHGDLGVKWDGLREREIEPILHAIIQMPQDQQDMVELALHSVFNLACETGINAMIEAALRSGEPDFASAMPKDSGPYHKSMWTMLNRPEIFETAIRIHQVDGLSWWRKRNDVPRRQEPVPLEPVSKLESEIERILSLEEGRGRRCSIEPMGRADGTDYFFCHPDDHARTIMIHGPDDRLTPRTIRETFPIVFAYNRHEGTLELYAKVPGKLKPKLESAFAETMLGVKLGIWKPDAVYRLNHLKDPMLDLTVDRKDGVRARIVKMRLSPRNNGRVLTVEVDGEADDIHLAIAQHLSEEYTPLSEMDVSLATFCFEFDAVDGRKAGTATFDVVFPNSCGLRNQRPERVALIQKYMKEWRIDQSGSPAHDLAETGD